MKNPTLLPLLLVICSACGGEAPGARSPATPAAVASPGPAAAPSTARPEPPPPTSPADVTGSGPLDVPTRLGLPNLRLVCRGQVPEVPRADEPPVNVVWEAFASPDTRDALTAHFDAVFGAAIRLQQGACDSWRFPPERPTSLLQLCTPAIAGPWSRCGPVPAGTGAVLMVSELASELVP